MRFNGAVQWLWWLWGQTRLIFGWAHSVLPAFGKVEAGNDALIH